MRNSGPKVQTSTPLAALIKSKCSDWRKLVIYVAQNRLQSRRRSALSAMSVAAYRSASAWQGWVPEPDSQSAPTCNGIVTTSGFWQGFAALGQFTLSTMYALALK